MSDFDPHFPFLVPPEDLKYAQVCKKVAKGQVVEVRQHVVFGDTDEILRLFGADSGGCINTSYIERISATRSYTKNCSNAIPSIRNDLIMACVPSNEEV